MDSRKICRTPNVGVLLAELKACCRTRNLPRGKQVHREAVECGLASSIYVSSALIEMYAKCGCMADARQVFDHMQHPNLVSWNVLIFGYVENGQGFTGLELFKKLRAQGLAPDSVTLVAALKACTSLVSSRGVLDCCSRGGSIHNLAVENGCIADIYVQSSLIHLYAKCSSMVEARRVFDNMKCPTVVSWTALILGYAEAGQGCTALEVLKRMKLRGVAPNCITVVAILKACTSLGAVGECRSLGKRIHALAVECCCDSDIYVQSALIDMYAKCGSMGDARQVFDVLNDPNVVSWNAVILGYAENGGAVAALDLFVKMRSGGIAPDSITLIAALKACVSSSFATKECRERIKGIHNLAIEHLCSSEPHVQSTLMDMYAKCGSMVDARYVFDSVKHRDVVSWTALISGYAENGEGRIALDLYSTMKSSGFSPNHVTLVAALKACTAIALKEGASSWAECRDRGREVQESASCGSDVYVQNTLIDMYAKCGSMVEARQVFESMKHPDVVSWNVLILGYVDSGKGDAALEAYTRMRTEGPAPDSKTFAGTLKACALLGALDFGRRIHSELSSLDMVLVTCLVDFYAKCGCMLEALDVFDLHAGTRDVITWNALLAGFSTVGDSESAFALFERMESTGFSPNGVTFLHLLSCCSHTGLVAKAEECFEMMSTSYRLLPTVEHYSCMVDSYGRANKLDEAMDLLKRMRYSPDDITWMSVLSSCRTWKNVGLGRLAFQAVVESSDSACMLMGQIYESRAMLRERDLVMEMRRKLRSETSSAESFCFWTNAAGQVHVFQIAKRFARRSRS